jgi:hypothetical protein
VAKLEDAAKRHREWLHFVLGCLWRVILDRARFGCLVDPTRFLAALSNFIALPSQTVKYFPRQGFRPYARLQWWRDRHSAMMILVESVPTRHFIRWPFRITFIADDATGLLPAQLFQILELIPGLRLLMIEIAFDFAGELTRPEILQRVLFAKARPAKSDKEVLRWGNRHSKMAKVYFKPEIGCWRFELELHSRFLNKHRIIDPYDFPRLAEILASHISFQTINLQKLMRRLERP